MDLPTIRALLESVAAGELSAAEASERLRVMPFDALEGIATVDHHRELRSGVPEIVYGETKTAEEISLLLASLATGEGGALATRVNAEKAARVALDHPSAIYHERAGSLVIPPRTPRSPGRGPIAVVCAGTSDLPVADEAAVALEFLGQEVRRYTDIGIAGLQRLVAAAEELRACEVVIAVAGFEGALPSAISGLVPAPVIAVPTSIGYGVGLGGVAAVMTMLAGCSPGVMVVNIDNGLGAAVCATRMNRRGHGR